MFLYCRQVPNGYSPLFSVDIPRTLLKGIVQTDEKWQTRLFETRKITRQILSDKGFTPFRTMVVTGQKDDFRKRYR